MIVKKNFYLLCVCVAILSFNGKGDKINLIKVLKIPFSLESASSIKCADFENTPVPFNYKTFIIKDKKDKQMILDNISSANDFYMKGIDARAKMYIYYESGKVDTLCFCSTTAFYYNGKHKLLKSRQLVNFLDSLPYNSLNVNGDY